MILHLSRCHGNICENEYGVLQPKSHNLLITRVLVRLNKGFHHIDRPSLLAVVGEIARSKRQEQSAVMELAKTRPPEPKRKSTTMYCMSATYYHT